MLPPLLTLIKTCFMMFLPPSQYEENDSITSSQINKEYIKTSYILSTTA